MIYIKRRELEWEKEFKSRVPLPCHCCHNAVTRIRTEVAAATTQSTNHYTITARYRRPVKGAFGLSSSTVIGLPIPRVTKGSTYGAGSGLKPSLRMRRRTALLPVAPVLSSLDPVASRDGGDAVGKSGFHVREVGVSGVPLGHPGTGRTGAQNVHKRCNSPSLEEPICGALETLTAPQTGRGARLGLLLVDSPSDRTVPLKENRPRTGLAA